MRYKGNKFLLKINLNSLICVKSNEGRISIKRSGKHLETSTSKTNNYFLHAILLCQLLRY